MYFVISPAKDMRLETMKVNKSIPSMIEQTELLMNQLQLLNMDELMAYMQVSEKIAKLNYQRFASFAFDEHGQAAIDTYYGLQFKQLSLSNYSEKQLQYLNEHIRILSGLYGVLKPFDSIYPYRLDMKYKQLDLYKFWKEKINHYFANQIVVNVASNEYGDILVGSNLYQVVFKQSKNGKLISQSTQVKQARGVFIDFVIKHQIESLDEIKSFHELDYTYDEQLSNDYVFVFVKE